MAGTITPTNIDGSLDAKNIAMRVLKGAVELTDLAPMCMSVQVPELVATIPVYSVPSGNEDLEPMEESDIGGSDFTKVDFDLKKDRVKVAVTDEARYKSRAGDPLTLQISGASDRLAQLLNKKIVAAAKTTPQTDAGADWSGANNPLVDLATAIAALRPYKADYCLMGSTAFANYTGKISIPTASQIGNAVSVIPGYNIPIMVSTEMTADSAAVVASRAPGMVIGNGPVKVRRKDLMSGAEVYQIDVWREVVSNIHDTGSTTNKAVYVLTGLDG
ncbi:hypothetical protein [Methanolobus psychrotolerans]|uniref:hypothetical protein n=1 Tax=Methanolobus psychrotolerans TaxID=1874706 RepID=UPI000B91751B|nr:hypothetical protein [Methanolobus psychrotolerans]